MVTRRRFVQTSAGGALLTLSGVSCTTSTGTGAELIAYEGPGIPHFGALGAHVLLPGQHRVETPGGPIGELPSDAAGSFNYPVAAVSDNEALYVLEMGNARVQRFQGGRIDSFGSYGGGELELRRPRDIALGDDGMIYIADGLNHRVQVITTDLRFVRTLGSEEHINGARSVALDERGNVHVATDRAIAVFDASGRYVASYGTDLPSPRCIRRDQAGHLHVVDAVAGCVARFDADGTMLDMQTFDGASPRWLAADPDGSLHVSLV